MVPVIAGCMEQKNPKTPGESNVIENESPAILFPDAQMPSDDVVVWGAMLSPLKAQTTRSPALIVRVPLLKAKSTTVTVTVAGP